MSGSKISIIVPAYNEEETIGKLIKELFKYQPTAEIIVVDDHSTDKTADIVKQMKKKHKQLVLLPKKGKRGKTTSLLQGFRSAKGNLLVMIDADLQYPASKIPEMIKLIEKNKADIAIASRKAKFGLRRILSLGFTWFFGNLLLGIPATDIQTGEKAFKKEIIDKIKIKSKKWEFDVEFLYKANKAGYRIAEVPIRFRERKKGKAKISMIGTSLNLASAALRLFMEKL